MHRRTTEEESLEIKKGCGTGTQTGIPRKGVSYTGKWEMCDISSTGSAARLRFLNDPYTIGRAFRVSEAVRREKTRHC